MLMTVLMLIFGGLALSKGEFKITGGRRVRESTGRVLGVMLLLGAGGSLLPEVGVLVQFILLIAVIVIGIAYSERIERAPATLESGE